MDKIKSSEIDSHEFSQLISDEWSKARQWSKRVFQWMLLEKPDNIHISKNEGGHYLTPFKKLAQHKSQKS